MSTVLIFERGWSKFWSKGRHERLPFNKTACVLLKNVNLQVELQFHPRPPPNQKEDPQTIRDSDFNIHFGFVILNREWSR